MKENLKFIFLALFSFVIFFEGSKMGLWLMNQANTVMFYFGLFFTIGCIFGLYLVTYQQVKQLVNQFKNQK